MVGCATSNTQPIGLLAFYISIVTSGRHITQIHTGVSTTFPWMSHQGCRPTGAFIPGALALPTILDLPSTSNQNHQTSGTSISKKLPLYGPLDIRDYGEFLRQQAVLFKERYQQSCPKVNNLDKFECLYILGRGEFSRIVVARNKSEDKYYALKIYNKHLVVKNKLVEKVLEEKRILQSLDCPFCIRLENLYQDTFELTFLLPFVSGVEIFTHLQRHSKFTENISVFYAAQVVLALEYMHHCDLIYRDLKPEHMHLDHLGYLKITKFRYAKVVKTRTYTFCGTPEYVAPEMIAGKGYGKAVDWWAFGVLVFELNVGHPPFISSNIETTYKNITTGRYSVPSAISRDLQDLIQRLLQPDVSKRAGNLKKGAEEIKSHNWFSSINWAKLLNRQIDPPFIPRSSGKSIEYPSLASSGVHDHAENVDEYFKDF